MERRRAVRQDEDVVKGLVARGQDLQPGLQGVIDRLALPLEDALGQKAVVEADPALAADAVLLSCRKDLAAGVIAVVGDELAVGDGLGREGIEQLIGGDAGQLVHGHIRRDRQLPDLFVGRVPDVERLAVGQQVLFSGCGRQHRAHARIRHPQLRRALRRRAAHLARDGIGLVIILRPVQIAHDALHVAAADLQQRRFLPRLLGGGLRALRRVGQHDGVALALAEVADEQHRDHADDGQRRKCKQHQKAHVFPVLLRRPSHNIRHARMDLMSPDLC